MAEIYLGGRDGKPYSPQRQFPIVDEDGNQLRVQPRAGTDLYVDTDNGDDDNDGSDWTRAFATMAAAFAVVTDNSRIYMLGDVREQILAPLGVQGVAIIGAAGGRTRHDDGARWYAPAVVADQALLTLREQGWEVHNILFVPPKASYAAIQLRRAEDATYPDGSHAIIRGCKFIADAGIAISDYGGCHHVLIEDCEFDGSAATLDSAILGENTGIANPLRWLIQNNKFNQCDAAIDISASECVIRGNLFQQGSGAIVDLTGGAGYNWVLDNWFPDATADYDTGHGYVGAAATDIWRNWVTDAADPIVTDPAA